MKATVLLALLLLSGCGGSGDDTATVVAAPAVAQTPPVDTPPPPPPPVDPPPPDNTLFSFYYPGIYSAPGWYAEFSAGPENTAWIVHDDIDGHEYIFVGHTNTSNEVNGAGCIDGVPNQIFNGWLYLSQAPGTITMQLYRSDWLAALHPSLPWSGPKPVCTAT